MGSAAITDCLEPAVDFFAVLPFGLRTARLIEEAPMKLLTTIEAAEYLGLKKNTLEIWRWRGCGPAYKKFGHCVRYAESDLLNYIESHTRHSTSEQAV